MLKKITAFTVLLGLASISSTATASEYESAWVDTEQCFVEYEPRLKALPNVETTPLSDLLAAYDEHANETRCLLMFGLTERDLENIGYFEIIEYRDDLYHRKIRYRAVINIFHQWKADVKATRPDFNAALQARIDAKPKPFDLHEARMEWLNRKKN